MLLIGHIKGQESFDAKSLNRLQSVVMGSIQYVKNGQDEILNMLDSHQQLDSFSNEIPIIQPSMRWAQNPQSVFIEVKYSTRFDSPACLDIFDTEFEIKNG